MYRLREMDVDDKVCEQVSMTMLGEVYPKDVIERCVQQSEPWSTKARRVRLSTALTLVFFVIAMALWSRRNQCQVWQSLVGKLSDLRRRSPRTSAGGTCGRGRDRTSVSLERLHTIPGATKEAGERAARDEPKGKQTWLRAPDPPTTVAPFRAWRVSSASRRPEPHG